MSAYKQMRAQDHPVLANFEEETFDRAFDVFKPGGLSANSKMSSADINSTL